MGGIPEFRERRANGRKDSWGVRFWGVGNESWGCGGIMRPEYYADVYRRYQNFCRRYGDHKLYKIACGPNDENTEWTETLMRNAAFCMDGLSLHHYTIPGGWDSKNSATEFTADDYWETLARAASRLEELESVLGVAARFRKMESGLEQALDAMHHPDYARTQMLREGLLRLDQEDKNGL